MNIKNNYVLIQICVLECTMICFKQYFQKCEKINDFFKKQTAALFWCFHKNKQSNTHKKQNTVSVSIISLNKAKDWLSMKKLEMFWLLGWDILIKLKHYNTSFKHKFLTRCCLITLNSINPLNTSSWKSILDPFRVQMVE